MLFQSRPSVHWCVLTQCVWSVTLTTVEGIFWRKNGSGSLWGHICATISICTQVGPGTRLRLQRSL